MCEATKLCALPPEMLCHIGDYLAPSDLLALSATCHHLRTIFNTNTLWRQFTDRTFLSKTLNSINSMVPPKYAELQSTSLEPLCEQRVAFLKQSRLLSNIRHENFVRHTTSCDGFLSDFETQNSLNGRQITYNGIYLFVLDYSADYALNEVVKVFNIEEAPYLISTLKLENLRDGDYDLVIWIQVVGNKLVVCKDYRFYIYQIQVPATECPVLYLIHVNESVSFQLNRSIVIGHSLFIENRSTNTIQVWNIDDGKQLDNICPRIEGPHFKILGFSKDFKYVMLSTGILYNKPHVFVYDVELMQFTPFDPMLNEIRMETYGFMDMDMDLVVLLSVEEVLTCSIFVYCYDTSVLLTSCRNIEATSFDRSCIINNFFVLPTSVSLKVINLTTLDITWELNIHSVVADGIPENQLLGVEYFNITKIHHIVVVRKTTGAEMWDFEKRRKLMDLPQNGSITMNDTKSKLIVCDDGSLSVFTFW
uniref:F-box domain-containing protein n=1 Tax=Graphocephala atropunctata TaxID=36148 RepID=A0A1B6KSQ2_9HEMI